MKKKENNRRRLKNKNTKGKKIIGEKWSRTKTVRKIKKLIRKKKNEYIHLEKLRKNIYN